MGRQVVGVDDEAAALLEQYEYPYNRTQFKRILKEAVIRTDGPYICAKTIQEVIQRAKCIVFRISVSGPCMLLPILPEYQSVPG